LELTDEIQGQGGGYNYSIPRANNRNSNKAVAGRNSDLVVAVATTTAASLRISMSGRTTTAAAPCISMSGRMFSATCGIDAIWAPPSKAMPNPPTIAAAAP